MVGSISSGWSSNNQTSKVWQDRMVEAQAKSRAVEDRHDVAKDRMALRQDWQTTQTSRAPKVSGSGSVDMYM